MALQRIHLLWLAVDFLNCFQQGIVHGWRSRYNTSIQVKPSSFAKVQWRSCKRNAPITVPCKFLARVGSSHTEMLTHGSWKPQMCLSVPVLFSTKSQKCLLKKLT